RRCARRLWDHLGGQQPAASRTFAPPMGAASIAAINIESPARFRGRDDPKGGMVMARKDSRPDVSRRKFLAGVAVAGAAASTTAAKAATPGTTAADVKRLPAAGGPTAHQVADESGLPKDMPHLAGKPNSDFMVDVIKSLKIDYVYSNPASSFRGLHESLINYGKNTMPEFITCMHEESSVAMCHGHYK